MTSVKTMLSTEGWGWKVSTEKQLIAKFLGSIRKKISQNFNYLMAHREQLSYPAIICGLLFAGDHVIPSTYRLNTILILRSSPLVLYKKLLVLRVEGLKHLQTTHPVFVYIEKIKIHANLAHS